MILKWKHDGRVWHLHRPLGGNRLGWVYCAVYRSINRGWTWDKKTYAPSPFNLGAVGSATDFGECKTLATAMRKLAPHVKLPRAAMRKES